MGSYSFKSSGKTQEQSIIELLERSPTPMGIKTPLRPGINDEGIFAMSYSLGEQVNDNLRNLIQTNWGERLGLYDFGANLRPITSEFVSQDDFDAQAVERINNAVSRWMPYVSLESFLSEVDRTENKNTGVIKITITYGVPALNITKRSLLVTLYVL